MYWALLFNKTKTDHQSMTERMAHKVFTHLHRMNVCSIKRHLQPSLFSRRCCSSLSWPSFRFRSLSTESKRWRVSRRSLKVFFIYLVVVEIFFLYIHTFERPPNRPVFDSALQKWPPLPESHFAVSFADLAIPFYPAFGSDDCASFCRSCSGAKSLLNAI